MPFDFAAVRSPFRMQPGLRALAPGSAQLTPNAPGDRALAEKLEVLSRHADEALVAKPGFDAAAAIDALSRHAAVEAPDAWRRHDDAHVAAPRLGAGRGDHRLRGADRLVAPPRTHVDRSGDDDHGRASFSRSAWRRRSGTKPRSSSQAIVRTRVSRAERKV